MNRLNSIILVVAVLALVFVGCRKEDDIMEEPIKQEGLKGKRVLLVIASSDFRDEEYFVTKEVIQESGVEVVTASSKLGKIKGMLGGEAESDILLSNAKVEDYDAVVFIGGSGAREYWDNQDALDILKEADNKEKVIAAICIAPVTLANSGVLKDKEATCYSSVKEALEKEGVKYKKESVVIDGRFITADGPTSSREFGKGIIGALKR